MESRPPSIPHPPFPRPLLFSTAPQHSRQYGSSQPQTSRPEARSHTAYDSLRRPADEPTRAMPTYGYAAHSYNPDLRNQTRSTSPTRFGAMQPDVAKRSALTSPVKNNGILGKDSAFYRDAIFLGAIVSDSGAAFWHICVTHPVVCHCVCVDHIGKAPIGDPFLRWKRNTMIGAARGLPSDPGNASRFRPALRLASSGVARTPARMAQGIVGQTSDHEIRRFPMQLPSFVGHATHLISTGPGEPLVREPEPESQVSFFYCCLFSRDHGFGSVHRPGASMSISSMLGSDPDRPSRDHPTSLFSRPSMSSPFGASRNSSGAMSPPNAPARPPSTIDHPLMRRSQTPDKPFAKDPLSRQSSRSESGGFSDSTKFSFGRSSFSQYPEKSTTTQKSPRNATASDPPFGHSRRVSLNSAIQRPSSQPQQEETRAPAYSPRTRTSSESIFGSTHHNTSYLDHETRPFARYGGIYSDRAREEQLAREREKEKNTTHEPERKPAFGLLHGRYGVPPAERDENRPNRPSWEIGRSQPKSPEARRFTTTASESGSGSGFGFGSIQSYTKSLGSQLGASRSAPATTPSHSSFSLHSRQSQPTPPPHEQSFLGKTQSQPRPLSVTSAPSASQSSLGASGSAAAAAAEEQRRKGSDDLMQHRTLLGIGADGKRAGRASPLPQAVQGAQAQFIGSAGETGIKGELGRVFAGIGSGVGTGPSSSTGSGPPTPMTASPFKRDSFGASEHVDEGKAGRGGAALSRKRSSKDEEPTDLGEPAQDLRGTPSTRGGSRRGRHVHHHHHHHHHHRYKNEDEGVAPRTTPGTTSVMGKAPTPTEPVAPVATTTPAHHHHHHHHHHHAPRNISSTITSAPSVVPLRDARTLVNIKPLLESVAQLPRHHLGSTLYAPRIGVPSANSSGESQKFGYTSTPVPIPRFEGKENCTFTIRVPRFRIDPSHREEICARRAVWGTGVYTDDSDPVAAAIHSGYIRGEWGEDVDISMLDLEIKSDYHHAPQPTAESGTTTAKPLIPPVPPPNKDLHITLLILPRLERYESTLMFGLKSRAWEGNHDGMSFKVERIEWVDEGSTRGEERSGAARRKRLRNMMQTGRICTGPGLLRMRGGPGSLLGSSSDLITNQTPTSAPVQPVS
ncbi:conserved hypothetical protein [Talaromyces marneffei ATCC 18224]|uniref:Histone deacetylation protein Rxt3 n=1 Tax=Talaromyces marneffei (strain ATCC 18224 / CBS 334.59 / QM 7333) TaxID=441960 RepID=B6QGY9_TALMQ|nr:conserved hypothetical protein [Talaromyces marneffei ATCC 18224]